MCILLWTCQLSIISQEDAIEPFIAEICIGRGGVMVKKSDSQSRDSGFESSCLCFEASAISLTPCCLS